MAEIAKRWVTLASEALYQEDVMVEMTAHGLWARIAVEPVITDLRQQLEALMARLRAEQVRATYDLDAAATIGARIEGVQAALNLIDSGGTNG